MKQFNLLVILSIIVVFTACKNDPKEKFTGTWQLESVEGENLSEKEKEIKITFKADGNLERSRDEEKVEGKWTVGEDGKTIEMTIKERKEVMNIVSVDGKLLVFTDGKRPEKITLKKI